MVSLAINIAAFLFLAWVVLLFIGLLFAFDTPYGHSGPNDYDRLISSPEYIRASDQILVAIDLLEVEHQEAKEKYEVLRKGLFESGRNEDAAYEYSKHFEAACRLYDKASSRVSSLRREYDYGRPIITLFEELAGVRTDGFIQTEWLSPTASAQFKAQLLGEQS